MEYKDESDRKRKKIILLLLAIILLMVLSRLISVFAFQENDDYFFNRIFSGKETGVFENKIYFMKIIVGTILACLYHIIPSVPWFSIMLECCIICYCAVILFSALKSNGLIGDGLTTVLFSIFFFMVFFPQIINVQFTVAASALCCVTVVLIAAYNKTKRIYILSFIALMLAFSIRYECFLMSVPFIGIGMLIGIINCSDKKKEMLKGILFVCVCMLGVLLGTIADNVIYRDSTWKEFIQAGQQLFDYPDIPSYEENVLLFNELEISEAEWRVTIDNAHRIFNQNIGPSQIKRIANERKVMKKSPVAELFIKAVWENLKSVPALSAVLCLGYIFCIILGVNNRERCKEIYFMLAMIKFVTLLVWLYIVYKGRYPQRITVSLYYLEIACLYSACITYLSHTKPYEAIKKVCVKFWVIGIISVFLIFGLSYMKDVTTNVKTRLEYSSAYQELLRYFGENGQNFYYTDVAVISGGITGNIFDDDIECINQACMGGWLPRSPIYERKLKKCGLGGTEKDLFRDNVFLVFRGVDTKAKYNLEVYLREKENDLVFVTEKILETDQGTIYEIVRVEKKSGE